MFLLTSARYEVLHENIINDYFEILTPEHKVKNPVIPFFVTR